MPPKKNVSTEWPFTRYPSWCGLGWPIKDTALVAGLAVCVVLNENDVMAQNGGAFALMCWYERSR